MVESGGFWWAGQRRTTYTDPITPEPAVPQPDSTTSPIAPVPARDWGKTATIAIAACALVSSIGSCVAGWEAWRTSSAAERIAQAQFDVGGGDITVDQYVGDVVDTCTTYDRNFTALVTVHNRGRLASQVRLEVYVTDPSSSSAWKGVPANDSDRQGVSVAPLSSQTVKLDMSCHALAITHPKVVISVAIGGDYPKLLPAFGI